MLKLREFELRLNVRLFGPFPWFGVQIHVGPEDQNRALSSWVLYAALFGLIAIDLGFFLPREGFVPRAFGFIWILGSIAFLLTTLVLSLKTFANRELWKSPDTKWLLGALILPVPIMLFGFFGVDWLTAIDEGPQQITIALNNLHKDNALGIYQSGYRLGYPVRQFILASIPTYLFGHNISMFRLGFFNPFILAHFAFLAALGQLLQNGKCPRPWLWASSATLWVDLASYTLMNGRLEEQAALPVSVTMFYVAGLMRFVDRPTCFHLFWMTWSIAFLSFCHRPALATWPLAMLFTTALLFFPRYRSIPLLLCLLEGVISFIVGLAVLGTDLEGIRTIFGTHTDRFSMHSLWQDFQIWGCYSGVDLCVVPVPIALGSLLVLYYSVKLHDYRFPIVALWSAACVMAAANLTGSYPHFPNYDVLRAGSTLAFLAPAIAIFFMEYSPQMDRFVEACHWAARASYIYMLVSGICVVGFFRGEVTADHYASDLERMFVCIDDYRASGKQLTKLYVPPPLSTGGFDSFLSCTAPEVMIIAGSPPPGEKIPGNAVMQYANWKEGQPRPRILHFEIDPE